MDNGYCFAACKKDNNNSPDGNFIEDDCLYPCCKDKYLNFCCMDFD